jgi:hypothetical protein
MKKEQATHSTGNPHKTEFQKLAHKLSFKHSLHTVFKDFLQLSICGFHALNFQGRKDEQNEQEYFSIQGKYDKKEMDCFVQMLGHLQLITIEFPYQDFLGDFYMEHISKGHLGQFFTPYPIAECMGGMMIDKEDIGNNIADNAAGSGVLLLATAAHSPDNYFFATDIDETCVKMCVLNFFLHGLRGEVVHGNALSSELWTAYRVHLPNFGIEKIPVEITLQHRQNQRIVKDFERKQRKQNPLSTLKINEGTSIFSL